MKFEDFVTQYYMKAGFSGVEKINKLNHASRVADLCALYHPEDDLMYEVGLGHDLLEETRCRDYDLELHYPEIKEDVVAVTRKDGETYIEYIDRVKNSSERARKVKVYDILDHFGCMDTLKPSLIRRYLRALEILLDKEK